jgi:hypothetical protein
MLLGNGSFPVVNDGPPWAGSSAIAWIVIRLRRAAFARGGCTPWHEILTINSIPGTKSHKKLSVELRNLRAFVEVVR